MTINPLRIVKPELAPLTMPACDATELQFEIFVAASEEARLAPPSSRKSGLCPPRALICLLVESCSSNPKGITGPLFRGSGSSATAGRRGLYAIFADICNVKGSTDWTKSNKSPIDFVLSSLRVLHDLVGGCNGGCSHQCHGDEALLREVFVACAAPLAKMMASDTLAPPKMELVLSVVAKLVGEEPPPAVPADEISIAFGQSVVECILVCGGEARLRPALRLAVTALGVILKLDREVLSLQQLLRSVQFKQVLTLVERELRSIALRTPIAPGHASLLVLDIGKLPAGTAEDVELARALCQFVSSLHTCPSAWAAATAARKKFSPYVLFALIIRQPFVDVSVFGCRLLSTAMAFHANHRDVDVWKEFVHKTMIDDGVYPAVFSVLKRKGSGDDLLWASRVIKEFKAVSSAYAQSNDLPEQLRLGEDRDLIKLLVKKLGTLTTRLEEAGGGANYDDVNVLGELAKALSGLACVIIYNLHSRLAVARAKATKSALRALVAINSLHADRIVGRNEVEFEKPAPTVVLLHAHFGVLRMVYTMANVPSERSNFAQFSCAPAAVVKSMFTIWPFVPSGSCSSEEEMKMARQALPIGIAALEVMRQNMDLSLEIFAARHNDSDVQDLASSIVAGGDWTDSIRGSIPTSLSATLFIFNNCLVRAEKPSPRDQSEQVLVGLKWAEDEVLVKAFMKAVRDGSGGSSSFPVIISCFGRFASCVLSRGNCIAEKEAVARMWQNAGVFAAVSHAAKKLNDVQSAEAAFSVAFLALMVAPMTLEGIKGSDKFKAAWDTVVDTGVLELLDSEIEKKCTNRQAVDMLKKIFVVLRRFDMYNPSGAGGGSDESDESLRALLNSKLSTDNSLSKAKHAAIAPDSSVASSSSLPALETQGYMIYGSGNEKANSGLSARESALLGAQRGEGSRRIWPCSNPECSSVESESVQLKKCFCLLAQYCCVPCQRSDWSVHKRTCTFKKPAKKAA